MDLKFRSASDGGWTYGTCRYVQQTLQGTTYSDPLQVITGGNFSRFRGYSIRGFHRLKRLGVLLPHTAFTQFHCKGETTGESYWQYPTTAWYVDGPWAPSTVWLPTEEQCAAQVPVDLKMYVQRAAAQIYSDGYDALTALAEMADIRRTFLSTGKRILSLRFPRNWREMTNDWLNLRYGWRPLIGDVKSLHESILSYEEKASRKRYSQRSGDSFTTTYSNPSEGTDPGVCTWVKSHVDHISVSLRGSVVADITVPPFQFNPVATAWEIVPYSFVVDWFLNVGTGIAAASFLALQTCYQASYGFRVTIDREYTYRGVTRLDGFPDYPFTLMQTGTGSATLEVRVPCGVPIFPRFALRLDPYKVIDLVGLIKQRL